MEHGEEGSLAKRKKDGGDQGREKKKWTTRVRRMTGEGKEKGNADSFVADGRRREKGGGKSSDIQGTHWKAGADGSGEIKRLKKKFCTLRGGLLLSALSDLQGPSCPACLVDIR